MVSVLGAIYTIVKSVSRVVRSIEGLKTTLYAMQREVTKLTSTVSHLSDRLDRLEGVTGPKG